MRSVYFIVDGYLSKDYLIEVAKKCNLVVKEKNDSNELYISDDKTGKAFYIEVNKQDSSGKVIYDDDGVIEDLKDKRLKMTNPTWNLIMYCDGDVDMVIDFLSEIEETYPRMFTCFDGENKFKKF